jgi:hypothetical protein
MSFVVPLAPWGACHYGHIKWANVKYKQACFLFTHFPDDATACLGVITIAPNVCPHLHGTLWSDKYTAQPKRITTTIRYDKYQQDENAVNQEQPLKP